MIGEGTTTTSVEWNFGFFLGFFLVLDIMTNEVIKNEMAKKPHTIVPAKDDVQLDPGSSQTAESSDSLVQQSI